MRQRLAPGLDGARGETLFVIEVREPRQGGKVIRLEMDGCLVLVDRLVQIVFALQQVGQHEVMSGRQRIHLEPVAQESNRLVQLAVPVQIQRLFERAVLERGSQGLAPRPRAQKLEYLAL